MTKKNSLPTVLLSLGVLLQSMLAPLAAPRPSLEGVKIDVEATVQPGRRPDVACDTFNNRYIVVYELNDGPGKEIFYTIRNMDGTPLTMPINISNHPNFPDSQPAVAYQPLTKQYLVVWTYGTAAGSDIYGQLIGDTGIAVGGPIQIAVTALDEAEPDVAANPLPGGNFLVGYLKPSGGVDLIQGVVCQRRTTRGAVHPFHQRENRPARGFRQDARD